MNTGFASGLARLPQRTIRVVLTMVLLVVVAVFGVFSFTSPVHAAATAQPNATGSLIFTFPNQIDYILCVSREQGGPLGGPESAINNCQWRVWLYQNAAHTGTALCINPDTATGTLHTRWEYYWISANKSKCG